eukprot:CAMPEP_0194130836 /NCGR_PEP_ID=MMETSP0152-20130528/1768_1 /TAXON_ID=1049557 /ORGANISM="Thalassiothrix antarctica, Strain L6-D1" /LENGTH=198 /DNA_ID=CAMNT_0038825453 /DNA_START=45 /DNA_END=641 /DNA_ORIENTATION=+
MHYQRLFLVLCIPVMSVAFTPASSPQTKQVTKLNAETKELESILGTRYPTFYSMIKDNDGIWKEIQKPEVEGCTIFCPSEDFFRNLDTKKRTQLKDDRNSETAEKIGTYHIVNEAVDAEALFNSGGVVTLGGEVLVGRSISGGVFGLGGTEDGSSTIGGAKVTLSEEVGASVIHEVDNFVSPNILWRFMDQLRIPGSQ